MDNNQEEDPKQPPRKIPDLTLFEQANSQFAHAASLANSHFTLDLVQANPSLPSPRLSTIESGGETEEDDDDDDEEISSLSEEGDNDYEYFDSFGYEEEAADGLDEFLGDQESEDDPEEDDFLEEDEIDPDELSYEELIALGEFIGVEKQGLAPSEISTSTCLREFRFVSSQVKNGIDRCVVCQMEFEEEEPLVVLRPCDHPYHSDCVTKWLQTKKICPICGSEPSLNPTLGSH